MLLARSLLFHERYILHRQGFHPKSRDISLNIMYAYIYFKFESLISLNNVYIIVGYYLLLCIGTFEIQVL